MDKEAIFQSLKPLLKQYEPSLKVIHDLEDQYYLNTQPYADDQEQYFGSVQIRKNYVAYHLMPVYINPALLNDISEDLRKRMQGKSCFNFKKEDKILFQELATLTHKCFQDFQEKGMIS
jgi:hypothetical protein